MAKLQFTMTIPIPDLKLEHPDFYWTEHICISDVIEDYVQPLIDKATKTGSCICYMVNDSKYINEE